MSYDIPDEIKYREKIVFGLDLRQLGYACVFGLLAFFSYNLPLTGQAKLILPAFFSILGTGFILLNLEEIASDLWYYYTGVRKADSKSPRAQRLMGVRAIENSEVELMDGSLRAILQVEPINFSLLDAGQKAAFVSNYREFLNHLAAPIQILVRTENSDAEEVFRQMQEKMEGTDRKTAALFQDFFDYESKFLAEHMVRSRRYYVIVTQQHQGMMGKPSEEDRSQLEQRTKIIQEKLAACGLRSERLDTAALLSFFSIYSMHDYWEVKNEEPGKEVKQCCDTRRRKNRKSKKKGKRKQKKMKKSR
ncbi:MAG: hypothetical protein QW568_03740 [Candidatus Anstonellaceae archaeon]